MHWSEHSPQLKLLCNMSRMMELQRFAMFDQGYSCGIFINWENIFRKQPQWLNPAKDHTVRGPSKTYADQYQTNKASKYSLLLNIHLQLTVKWQSVEFSDVNWGLVFNFSLCSTNTHTHTQYTETQRRIAGTLHTHTPRFWLCLLSAVNRPFNMWLHFSWTV